MTIVKLSDDIRMIVPLDIINKVMQELCPDGVSVFQAAHRFDTMPLDERAELIRLHAEDGDIQYYFLA